MKSLASESFDKKVRFINVIELKCNDISWTSVEFQLNTNKIHRILKLMIMSLHKVVFCTLKY